MYFLYAILLLWLHPPSLLSLDCDISFHDNPESEWEHFGTLPCSREWCFDAAGTQWPQQNLDYHYRECDKLEWCKNMVEPCESGPFTDKNNQLVLTGTVCCCNTSDGCNRHLNAWKMYNTGGSHRKIQPQPLNTSDPRNIVEIRTAPKLSSAHKKEIIFQNEEISNTIVPKTVKPLLQTVTPTSTKSQEFTTIFGDSPTSPTTEALETTTTMASTSTPSSVEHTTILGDPPVSPSSTSTQEMQTVTTKTPTTVPERLSTHTITQTSSTSTRTSSKPFTVRHPNFSRFSFTSLPKLPPAPAKARPITIISIDYPKPTASPELPILPQKESSQPEPLPSGERPSLPKSHSPGSPLPPASDPIKPPAKVEVVPSAPQSSDYIDLTKLEFSNEPETEPEPVTQEPIPEKKAKPSRKWLESVRRWRLQQVSSTDNENSHAYSPLPTLLPFILSVFLLLVIL